MQFCVFSFNRGRFLRHCVESIEACAPQCPISIYDDGSDDPSTLEVLSTLEYRHRVVRHVGVRAGEGKHGGLYRNMQRAIEEQAPGEIVCFIQDDMQVVRAIDTGELDAIADTLDSSAPRLLHPAFLKACNRESDARDMRYDAERDGYLNDRFDRSAGAFYSDVFIASVDQLREVKWTFAERESLNEARARQSLQQMLILRNPFVAWLPHVPAWRGRTRTYALRVAERTQGSGFYPIEPMSESRRAAFMARDPRQLPVAEDFLAVRNEAVKPPWTYHPLQGRRWLTLLDSVERKLRG